MHCPLCEGGGFEPVALQRRGVAGVGDREPEANCSVTVVDPVLKPIVYPPVQELALPAAAPVSLGAQVHPLALSTSPPPAVAPRRVTLPRADPRS